MPLPILETQTLFPFPANALPRVSFSAFGTDYAGVQFTAFEGDELAWDSDVYGRWRGPAPLHATAANLSISGATYERGLDEFTELARLASGTAPVLSWELTNDDSLKGVNNYRVIVQNLSDGSFVYNATATGSPVVLPDLTEGSYTAWVRVESAYMKAALPDDYYSVTGYSYIPNEFLYEVGGVEFTWDWLHDVGVRPADLNQVAIDGETVMYDEYNKLMLSGSLETRGEWTTYIRSNAVVSGEWSALRVQVGAGAFTVGANVLPAPGAALVTGTGGVAFDILARSITAAKVLSNGKVRIAGSFATRDGMAVGYWDLHADGTATQLGCGVADSFSVCEMALLNHFASDIWEDDDGTQWVLTLANLRRFDNYKTDIQDRLSWVPLSTAGHPGGRCLRRDGAALKFFTENFAQGQGNFYNRLQIQSDARSEGVGTVFHGDNCSDLFMGRMYGWQQDKQFDQDDATQYLARLAYDTWDNAGMPSFAASAYNWQRLCAINADNGLRMLGAGINAVTQEPRWCVITPTGLEEASSPYRVRRMQAVETGAYAVAFTGDLVWENIHFTGDFAKLCFTWNDTTSTMAVAEQDAIDAGIDIAKLPPYLLWKEIETASGGGVWVPKETLPTGTFLTLANVSGQLQYNGTLPYDGNTWCRFCFTVYDDGGVGTDALEPDACCSNALCAAGLFDPVPGCPSAYESISISADVQRAPWQCIQVSDPNEFVTRTMRKLDSIGVTIPNLWARIDSEAAADDLASYDIRIPWNRRVVLPKPAKSKVDIIVLMPPCYEAVRAPVLERRD